METSKRARRRKSDTAKADLKPPLAVSGGQGVHREMESEGHEEKFRAVIKGSPSDEPVGQRWVRSSPHHEGEGVLIHPPYQGDCGRHGTEEQRVTSGGLTESPGGARVSGPISASEGASHALPVDGRLCSYHKRSESCGTEQSAIGSGSGKAAGEDGGEERGSQMSNGEKVDQFHE